MPITHFLWATHFSIINEFQANWHKFITRWLEQQRTQNSKLLEQYPDIDKAAAKAHAKRIRQQDQNRNKSPKY